jgi:hypothetical protein
MAEITREERLQLTQRLADSIIDVIGNHKHGMALDALLAVYRVVAKRHQCCTKSAADACFSSAVELAHHAAQQRAQRQGAEPGATPSQISTCTDMNGAEFLEAFPGEVSSEPYRLKATTSCRCSPSPSIPSVITSPFLR